MPSRSSAYAEQSDPELNRSFRRRWADRPMSSRELEHLSDVEAARGNLQRADALSWRAHAARTGASS